MAYDDLMVRGTRYVQLNDILDKFRIEKSDFYEYLYEDSDVSWGGWNDITLIRLDCLLSILADYAYWAYATRLHLMDGGDPLRSILEQFQMEFDPGTLEYENKYDIYVNVEGQYQ